MEQNLEPQRPRIGTEEVRRAADILRRYHAGKRQLEQRIIDNEQFWKLRHWQQMEKTGQGGNPADPQPTSGWLVNCILSKHADAMDCYPEPTVLPREPGDREEAGKLTRILPVILKKNGFKRTYSSAWWYKLKSGCAVYGVFWDAGKLNGLGDISIRRMDLLNLFWEPGVTDIQDSPHFFSTELQDREALEERYPQAKGGAPLTLAVGDGNHSLASAKACWEELKKTLTPEQAENHPARWCLAEVCNVHSPAIEIEPIHRVLFNVDCATVLLSLITWSDANMAGCCFGGSKKQPFTLAGPHMANVLSFEDPTEPLTVGTIDDFISDYIERHPEAKVDYVHDEPAVRALCKQGAVAFLMPPFAKSDLFRGIVMGGVLPRKTFSMGHAEEKRYYIECRKITE